MRKHQILREILAFLVVMKLKLNSDRKAVLLHAYAYSLSLIHLKPTPRLPLVSVSAVRISAVWISRLFIPSTLCITPPHLCPIFIRFINSSFYQRH